MTLIQLIQKELDNNIKELDQYEHYRNELDWNESNPETPISELIADADLESTDFNIGFEQGYMRGLEQALSLLTTNQSK